MSDTATSKINRQQEEPKVINLNGKKAAPAFDCNDFIDPETNAEPFDSESLTNNNTTGNALDDNVYIPTWENKPPEVKPVVSFNGSPILTNQNTSGIIASPGLGKSSLCEALAASFLNPDVDNLGFEVSPDCEGVLFIDNERTSNDVWNSFYRLCKRANIRPGAQLSKNVTIAGLRAIPRLRERVAAIEYLLQQKSYSLLLLDGAGDLVTDSNDLMQAIECRIWLRELTIKYNLAILTTIHPNPNTNKPRGHIGSEIHRECECVLLAKIINGDTRILTSDFEFGKNRNHAHATGAYKWSDVEKMFVSADLDSIAEVKAGKANRRKNEAERIALKVIPAPTSLSHTDLVNSIMDLEECSEPTAKRRIREALEFEFIKKHADGLYRANK